MRFIPFGFMRGGVGAAPAPPESCFTQSIANSASFTDVKVKYNSLNNKINVIGFFNAFGYTYPPPTSKNNFNELSYEGIINTGITVGTAFNNATTAIDYQSDGKLIIGGTFISYSGITANRIIRLNTNYSNDNTFNSGTGLNGSVGSIEVQSDDKILITGNFTTYNGTAVGKIIRLNSDGTLDTTFNNNVLSAPVTQTDIPVTRPIIIQPDGKILTGGLQYSTASGLVRLNSDGTVDTSFSTNMGTGFKSGSAGYPVEHMCLQADGKIVCTGYFNTFNTGSTINLTSILRLNSNGTLDTTFNVPFGSSTFYSFSPMVQYVPSSGKIISGGDSSYGLPKFNRLNTNGSIDNTFGYDAAFSNGTPHSFEILSNEKILFSYEINGGYVPIWVARMNSNGSEDIC